MGKEERNIYTIQKDESIGEVKIADEVVASIAAFAAMEVEGVASLGGMTKEHYGQAWYEVSRKRRKSRSAGRHRNSDTHDERAVRIRSGRDMQ